MRSTGPASRTGLWREGFAGLARSALQLAFPAACVFCGVGTAGERLCGPCLARLLRGVDIPTCRRCGSSVGPHVDREDCSACRSERFAFDAVVRLAPYADDLAAAILRIKNVSGHALAIALADLLVDRRESQLLGLEADLVLGVPLHWRRRWSRGFDQADLLASRLARRLSLPHRRDLLRRTRSTRVQHRLSPTERRTNPRGAFRGRPNRMPTDATILLVDDVVTTGATCHFAAKALREAGAARVVVATLARGEYRQA